MFRKCLINLNLSSDWNIISFVEQKSKQTRCRLCYHSLNYKQSKFPLGETRQRQIRRDRDRTDNSMQAGIFVYQLFYLFSLLESTIQRCYANIIILTDNLQVTPFPPPQSIKLKRKKLQHRETIIYARFIVPLNLSSQHIPNKECLRTYTKLFMHVCSYETKHLK